MCARSYFAFTSFTYSTPSCFQGSTASLMNQLVLSVMLVFCLTWNQIICHADVGNNEVVQITLWCIRAVRKFLSSRLIMNSRWLWNGRTKGSSLGLRRRRVATFWNSSLGNHVSRGFQEVFSTRKPLFSWNTRKTGNNAVKMSQAFHNIARFERFTDLNLFKYAFNIIKTVHLTGRDKKSETVRYFHGRLCNKIGLLCDKLYDLFRAN